METLSRQGFGVVEMEDGGLKAVLSQGEGLREMLLRGLGFFFVPRVSDGGAGMRGSAKTRKDSVLLSKIIHHTRTPATASICATKTPCDRTSIAAFAVCSTGPLLVVLEPVTVARALVAVGIVVVGSVSSVCSTGDDDTGFCVSIALVGEVPCPPSPPDSVEENVDALAAEVAVLAEVTVRAGADALDLTAVLCAAEVPTLLALLAGAALDRPVDGLASPPSQSAVPPSCTTIPTPATGSFNPLSAWNVFTSNASPSAGKRTSSISLRWGLIYIKNTYCLPPFSWNAPGGL